MTCDEIKERLIDFLYGELSPADRAAFEAHLVGCDGCRREVESLGGTLTTARTAVRSTLDDPPPSRVRVAVLEAARAAVGPAMLAAARTPVKPSEVAPKGSFWDFVRHFLRQRPWVLPGFAVASMAAVFFWVRGVVVPPRTVTEVAAPAVESVKEQPKSEDELDRKIRAVSEGVKVALPLPAEATPPPAANEHMPPRPPAAERDSYAKPPPPRHRAVSVASAPSKGARKPATPAIRAKEIAEDRLSGLLGASGRSSGAGAGPKDNRGQADEPAPKTVSRAEPGYDKRDDVLDQALKKAETRRYAPPPPPMGGVPQAAPQPTALPAPARAPAPKRAAEPVAPAPVVATAAEEAPAQNAYGDAEQKQKTSEKAAKKAKAPSPLEELSQRAERAFAAARWAEAASAYRQLIQLYPDHTLVASWKGRVRACDAQLLAERTAKQRSSPPPASAAPASNQ
jgi:anti-sigma factor RsiW